MATNESLAWEAASWAGRCTDAYLTPAGFAELSDFLIDVKRALLGDVTPPVDADGRECLERTVEVALGLDAAEQWSAGDYKGAAKTIADALIAAGFRSAVAKHWECDCVPDIGPSHCHACSDEVGNEMTWEDHLFRYPRPAVATPLDQVVADSIAESERSREASDWAVAHSRVTVKNGKVALKDADRSAVVDGDEQVTTVEELDALPEGTVILDRFGDVLQYRGGLWCSHETAPFGSEWVFRKYSPLMVLYRPVAPTTEAGNPESEGSES